MVFGGFFFDVREGDERTIRQESGECPPQRHNNISTPMIVQSGVQWFELFELFSLFQLFRLLQFVSSS